MSFLEFVAIRLSQVSDRTIDYKAISSFASSIRGYEDMSMDDMLKVWVANMIDRGLSDATRTRYIGKLSSLYKEYSAEAGIDGNPFDTLAELSGMDTFANKKVLQTELTKVEKIFDIIMSEAAVKPELAVFLYLLFNASSDMEKAIMLTTDDYSPEFPQLDEIINPGEFHHRRKYIFDLDQSRKRLPQLVRETTEAIDSFLRSKGIRLPDPFSKNTIPALWLTKAKNIGVSLYALKQVVNPLPAEFGYFSMLNGPDLDPEEISAIKRRVAEAFAPSRKRWYAFKLRRSAVYSSVQEYLKDNFQDFFNQTTLFYPQKEVSHRVDKRIVTEHIPLIPDVVFFNVYPRHVRKMDALIKSEHFGWVFRYTNSPDSDYSVIDAKSMACFQHMIGIFTPDIKIELTQESPIGIGREVLITGGILAGYEGKIFDIRDGSDMRQIYIRLSEKYSIKTEVKVDEVFVKPLIS